MFYGSRPSVLQREVREEDVWALLDGSSQDEVAAMVREWRAESDQDPGSAHRLAHYGNWRNDRQDAREKAAKFKRLGKAELAKGRTKHTPYLQSLLDSLETKSPRDLLCLVGEVEMGMRQGYPLAEAAWRALGDAEVAEPLAEHPADDAPIPRSEADRLRMMIENREMAAEIARLDQIHAESEAARFRQAQQYLAQPRVTPRAVAAPEKTTPSPEKTSMSPTAPVDAPLPASLLAFIQNMPAKDPAFSANWGASEPRPKPDPIPRRLDDKRALMGGFTAESLVAGQRGVPGIRELALRQRAATAYVGYPWGGGLDGTGEGSFDQTLVEIVARERAALAALAEGREMTLASMDDEAAPYILEKFWLGAPGLSALVSRAARSRADFASRLGHLRRVVPPLGDYLGAQALCDQAAELEGFRELLERRVAAIDASLEALPGALAARLAPVVEAVGGAEKLIGRTREASALAGTWPGPDRELDDLRHEHKDAKARMEALVPPRGEEPGELYEKALARHDELAEALAARESEVKIVAMESLRDGIGKALAGDPASFARLEARVVASPEAYPEGFGDSLREAARQASFDAGPAGFAYTG